MVRKGRTAVNMRGRRTVASALCTIGSALATVFVGAWPGTGVGQAQTPPRSELARGAAQAASGKAQGGSTARVAGFPLSEERRRELAAKPLPQRCGAAPLPTVPIPDPEHRTPMPPPVRIRPAPPATRYGDPDADLTLLDKPAATALRSIGDPGVSGDGDDSELLHVLHRSDASNAPAAASAKQTVSEFDWFRKSSPQIGHPSQPTRPAQPSRE